MWLSDNMRSLNAREWLVALEKGHAHAQLGKLLALLAELGLRLDVSPDTDVEVTPDQPEAIDLDQLLGEHDERSRRT